jgi:hypothetical protein
MIPLPYHRGVSCILNLFQYNKSRSKYLMRIAYMYMWLIGRLSLMYIIGLAQSKITPIWSLFCCPTQRASAAACVVYLLRSKVTY